MRANNDVATRSMNCRHPVVLLLLPLLTPMIFFFRPQGSVHVLDACHKCGSGRDRTPIMHKHSGNKGYIFADDIMSRWTPSKGATQKLSQSSFSGRRALFNVHVLDACHKCGSGHVHPPTMHLHNGNKGYIKFSQATSVSRRALNKRSRQTFP